uniref:Chemokine interleukin-8-like domain-containing protein n=1 Tax=Nothobranchius kadleci TaxID=1051664 RepID=A0A1A8DU40_NOTKA
MSAIIKVLLLLAILACISKAQINEPGQNCLCQRVRNGTISRTKIKDIQIYHATVFCSKVEIVVTNKNGYRYCLNPDGENVKNILSAILKKPSTSKPTGVFSTTSSKPSTHV